MSLTALAIVGALWTIDPPLYDSFVTALHEGQFLQLVIDLQPLDRAGLQVAMAKVNPSSPSCSQASSGYRCGR